MPVSVEATMESHKSKVDLGIQKVLSPKEKEESMKRLPKRLIYILRYGAVKEGLTVDENGFVPLDEVSQLNLLAEYNREEIMHEVESSISYRTNHRYESRIKDGHTYIRAAYLRRFEENPFHPGTQVKTLLETAICHVINNLDDYDLENFPDEDIIRRMFHRLKRQRKLTVKTLGTVLVPALTRIDLEGVFLTNNIMRTLYRQCPHLTAISFKGCGYIITDAVLTQIAKNIPGLEKLNLCQCNHLTAQSLSIMSKRLPHLSVLHAAGIPSLNFKSVLDFLNKTTSLTFLDIYHMLYTPQEYQKLNKVANSKGITLILRKPRSKSKVETELIDDVIDPDLEINQDKNNDDYAQSEMMDGQSDESVDESHLDAWDQWMDYVDSQRDNYYLEDNNDSWYNGNGDLSCHTDNVHNNDIR